MSEEDLSIEGDRKRRTNQKKERDRSHLRLSLLRRQERENRRENGDEIHTLAGEIACPYR